MRQAFSATDRGWPGERTKLAEAAGKTGEVGLPAISRLAHSPMAQGVFRSFRIGIGLFVQGAE